MVAGTLQANGKAAGSATAQDAESGLLAVHGTQDPDIQLDQAHPLGRNHGQENAVFAIQNATRGKDQNGLGIAADSPMYTLDQASQHAVFAIQAGALRTNPPSGPEGVGVQADHAYTLEARAEVQAVCVTGDITHTLKAEGFDGSEDGTGRGQPIAATAIDIRNGKTDQDGPAMTLQAGGIGEGRGMCINAIPHIQQASAVRRLTPTECERLQGMADDYTLIPWRGKSAEECPDGPRYKAIGNSKAVPVVRWIGQRIKIELRELP